MVKIAKSKFDAFVKELNKQYEVFAPVKKGKTTVFEPVTSSKPIDSDVLVTRKSPKEIFFPQKEVLFESDAEGAVTTPKRKKPIAVWGVRPCDAISFTLLDNVFGSAVQKPGDEYFQDSFWKDKYDDAVIFVSACNEPASTCFCHWFGYGPFTDTQGDVFVVDGGDFYLLTPVSDKGNAAMKNIQGEKASGSDSRAAEALKKAAEKSLSNKLDISGLKMKLASDWENCIWDDISAKCINCAACTYVCPTCHCFDVQDEQRGSHVTRIRLWDSCMYPIFTKEASGHNPRGSSKERVRQRVMHKYNYYVEKYDNYLCTGCGRCIQVCPVNFDIRDVLDRIISN